MRVILRPRGCSTCAWEDNDGEDAERPRKGPGSDGARKAPLVPWAGALARGATAAELEGAALVEAVIAFGEGVRERDLLRDLDREVDRGTSGWPSGELTMTLGPAGLRSIVVVEVVSRVVLRSIP